MGLASAEEEGKSKGRLRCGSSRRVPYPTEPETEFLAQGK